jgi:hypothetical protein
LKCLTIRSACSRMDDPSRSLFLELFEEIRIDECSDLSTNGFWSLSWQWTISASPHLTWIDMVITRQQAAALVLVWWLQPTFQGAFLVSWSLPMGQSQSIRVEQESESLPFICTRLLSWRFQSRRNS